ncbi:MAG: type I pullulanase [Bacteroidetes bacterium]|nr:type I pullulanase [Bacteroidota bacterium]
MKRMMMLFSFLAQFFSGKGQEGLYDRYPEYKGDDLGLVYSDTSCRFRIWAPYAERAQLLLYEAGMGGDPFATYEMKQSVSGTWLSVIAGNFSGKFYTFRTMNTGKWSAAVADPYVKLTGINGKRGMIADLSLTNPPGWSEDKSPPFQHKTDAIIYELHVRDASISASSGIRAKGKFIGLTELNTRNTAGHSTGLSHLKELGVTHVHLLPVFDYNSVDETKPDLKYNWGYDPLNYNVPEGSYATNAYDGITRIREFKELVNKFHRHGLRVVMDVVYNHTALTDSSYFNQLVPGYYYRQNKEGKFSNASACGNETASERAMFRKFMLESMRFWVKEYHIDGFRVDLMGIHDIETMNLITKELHKIKPDILIYGEGWTAGASPLPDSLRAIKANVSKLDRIAVFSDDIRDGIKGSVFDHKDRGFASGKPGMEQSIRFGVVAACKHPQVDYAKVNYSKKPYAKEPWQTISYCECHDNHVLWDKLRISAPDATLEERTNMHKLALSIVLTSQGISFIHAGTEFLRTKKGVENSFESADSINAIDWDLKTQHYDVFEYVKGLIQLRKAHPAFRLTLAKSIARYLHFDETTGEGLVAYTLDGKKTGDSWKRINVYFNGTGQSRIISPGKGIWKVAIQNNQWMQDIPLNGSITMKPYSCTIVYMK